ncbi:MAG: hypothetical protein ACLPWD_08725 [Methanobacterium sp.]
MRNVNVARILMLFITTLVMMNAAAATCNVIIITDPTGQSPNGAAAGSMSFDNNMFESTFINSPEDKFAILSGGADTSGTSNVVNDTPRLQMIVQCINVLKGGANAETAASVANSFSGQRLVVGGPTIGAAIAGTSGNYVIEVANDGTITITPYNGGIGVLPPGTKGAVLHLLHTPGNPQPDNTSAVGLAAAEMIGEQIRDGYPATEILANTFKIVAIQSGEKYGGGAVNLDSGISTEDTFTPSLLNQTGFPMDQPYAKIDNISGWSVGYPDADSYTTSPIDNNPLTVEYATTVLQNYITVGSNSATVSAYGTDDPGIIDTTQSVVESSVSEHGFDATQIASDINKAISSDLLVGVQPVEPDDIHIETYTKQVGVYFTPLANGRTAPVWNLPISSSLLESIGNLQTAIGLIMVVLVIFRSTLISSFSRRRKKL